MNIIKWTGIILASIWALSQPAISAAELAEYRDVLISAVVAAALLPRVSEWFE
jgi:hypothetical protein